MVKVKVYGNGQAHVGADLALKKRLYVSGWSLSGELLTIRERKDNKSNKVSIVYKDKEPVGVAILASGEIQAFVRKSERRNGFGKMAVESLQPDEGVRHGYGIDGSMTFWNKVLEK